MEQLYCHSLLSFYRYIMNLALVFAYILRMQQRPPAFFQEVRQVVFKQQQRQRAEPIFTATCYVWLAFCFTTSLVTSYMMTQSETRARREDMLLWAMPDTTCPAWDL